MLPGTRPRFSFEDYLRLEDESAVKHEFLDGVVWAMAGGTPEHAAIAANIIAALGARLRGRPCRVYSSDLRVRVRATGLCTYPDVTVVCGKQETDADDKKNSTVINPRVLVEVLSPTTEAYDRGEKLEHYKQITSLEEIVLVAHEEPRLEIWRREGGHWILEVARTSGSVVLRTIDCELPLEEVYRNPLAT
jgi:Uma2 family endonuclease